jgi:hypothetical protein
VEWINLAHDGVQWHAILNTAIKFGSIKAKKKILYQGEKETATSATGTKSLMVYQQKK